MGIAEKASSAALPFQGAPFRALFVYHVRMLCHLLFDKKNRAEIFLDFEPISMAVAA